MDDLPLDVDGNEVIPTEEQLEALGIEWNPEQGRWIDYEAGETA